MSVTERIKVVPEVLVWARETAGYSLEAAAKRLGPSEDTIRKWESGEQAPTIKQLRNAAALYKRPLAVLLLPQPPKDFMPLKDFRRQPGTAKEISPQLSAQLKRAQMQRDVFLELIELAPSSVERPGEPPSLRAGTDPESAGLALRASLNIDADVATLGPGPHENLNNWIEAVEGLGILVIHTQRVSVDEVRGFSIADAPFPVIALNGGDWPRPRLFTLIHELCHIALNNGGLCDLHEVRARRRTAEDETEHYCNQVAASVLMPKALLLGDSTVSTVDLNHPWTLDELSRLSSRFGSSSEATLLRLITLEKAAWDLYWTRKAELDQEYQQARESQRERQRESEGGPSYYIVKARDLGHGYVTSVFDAYRSKAISSLDVVDYLDIKYDQLPKLERVLHP